MHKKQFLFVVYMFVAFVYSTKCYSQIQRIGILKAKIVDTGKTNNNRILEIEYSNNKYAHFINFSGGKKVSEGLLNRIKYNSYPGDTNNITMSSPFSEGVLSDGYIRYNPHISFTDTLYLLEYDLNHLLTDSLVISYSAKSIDTCKYNIYKSDENFYYSMPNGCYYKYDLKGNHLEKYYYKKIANNLFLFKLSTYKKNEVMMETITLIGPKTFSKYAEMFLRFKDDQIDSSSIFIDDSLLIYKDHMLIKEGNTRK